MAGAGIGLCIICGRDNQPCVSDICQDCTMDEFWFSLKGDVPPAYISAHVLPVEPPPEEVTAGEWMTDEEFSVIMSMPTDCFACGSVNLVRCGSEVNDETGQERHKWECETCGDRFWGEWFLS